MPEKTKQIEKLKKNDFVELEYTGRIKNGGVFDTNIEKDLKKINPELKKKPEPVVICLGQNMILPAIDEFLIGKELREYSLELAPEKAFGSRKRELVKTMPMSVFKKQNVAPQMGMVFSFDNMMGKITAVSGGRVIVDFNNPIAGKDVIYQLKAKRKISEQHEKIKSLMKAYFKKEFKFKVENKKIIVQLTEEEKQFQKFIEMLKPKFKEILDMDISS